jgi:FkbM family methyltransferase
MYKKIRIAFIKFGGLSVGGAERCLQIIAANLPKDQFVIDYYYCDAAPYIGSNYKHGDTNQNHLKYMRDNNINLIKFHVGAKDITTPTHDWVNTNFWKVFDHQKYDLVQTVKAGPAEYPYYLINLPIVEIVGINAGVDLSPNIAWSIHPAQWQKIRWVKQGGSCKKSSVIPVPVFEPCTNENLRTQLNIPESAIVAGFHQRPDFNIFSKIPLQAFAKINNSNHHFVIMGGSKLHRDQGKQLKLKNVHFIQASGDNVLISKFLNTIDIFAHGRKDGETFGIVFAEAMMHGKPCLSHWSPVSNAQPETMGPAGLFATDLDDYTNKLKLLFENSELRNKLASKAQPHAKEYYSLESCIERFINIYYKVLNKKYLTTISIPTSYGQSPLGFLYAGKLEQPDHIANHVMKQTIPEEFDLHITKFFLPHISTFIDIGSNTGLYGLVAANEGKNISVHCFEPQPDCCKTLEKTISLNNWEKKVYVHQLGLSNKPNILDLQLTGTGSSFFHEFNNNPSLPTIKVPVDSLDNQIEKLNIKKVDFIKIDVEGLEQKVLEGSINILEKDKPVLFIEVAKQIKSRNFKNPYYITTINLLKSKGYIVLRSTEKNTLILNELNTSNDGISMYLCLHKNHHKKWLSEIHNWCFLYRRTKIKQKTFIFAKKITKAVIHPRWAIKKCYAKIFQNK